MYQKPAIQRFGTFREVTKAGEELGFGDTAGVWQFFLTAPSTS